MRLYEPAVPARYTALLLEALREQHPPWLEGVLAGVGLASMSCSAAAP